AQVGPLSKQFPSRTHRRGQTFAAYDAQETRQGHAMPTAKPFSYTHHLPPSINANPYTFLRLQDVMAITKKRFVPAPPQIAQWPGIERRPDRKDCEALRSRPKLSWHLRRDHARRT